MSIRTRTTKLIARRHDLNYFKRMSRVRAWQWYLAAGALVCAILWFAGTTIAHGDNNFSAGPISSSHAVFGQRCELCHIPTIQATRFTPSFGHSKHVPDSACLSCHAAAAHHPMESVKNATCSSCHTEHIGSTHLANVADNTCTACHARLESRAGALRVAANVSSFAHEHPDFRPMRTATLQQRDAAVSLRFTHATHMHPGLRNELGGTENLQCQSCHQSTLTSVNSTVPRQGFTMAPVDFDQSCRSCHSLEFDSHLKQQAPHTYVKDVRIFVQGQIASFAQQHPDVVAQEIRNWPTSNVLPGQGRMPAPHNTQEWIASSTLRAETILYREKCELCHKDLNRTSAAAPSYQASLADTSMPAHRETMPAFNTGSPLYSPLLSDRIPATPAYLPVSATTTAITPPAIEPFHQPEHWYKDAVFSHAAHQAETCTTCHAQALTTNNPKDIMMPTIATCRSCHDGMSSPQGPPVKAGHAESGCYLCHVYHGPAEPTLRAAHDLPQLLGH